MSVYTKDGVEIFSVYSTNGSALNQAYDINGNPLLDSREPTNRLTIMQYNVGQWYTGSGSRMPSGAFPNYSYLHKQIFRANAPDIVTFQEYVDPVITDHPVSELTSAYFTDHVVGGSGNYMTKAIYTNGYALSAATYKAFNVASGWGFLRSSVEYDGKTIHIINCHMENDATSRAAQAAELFELVSSLDYFILIGDWNTTCMSVADSDYDAVMKQFVDAGYHCANCSPEFGFYNTWFAGHNFNTVDYESRGAPNDNIVTSSNLRILRVYRDEHKIPVCEAMQTRLDHAPLVAVIEMQEEEQT